MKKTMAAAAVLLLFLSGAGWAGMIGESKSPAQSGSAVKLTVVGKIGRDGQDYFVRGEKPSELYGILNPNPKVLDRLVRSGKTVALNVQSVLGDQVNITKIDGKRYPAPRAASSVSK